MGYAPTIFGYSSKSTKSNLYISVATNDFEALKIPEEARRWGICPAVMG